MLPFVWKNLSSKTRIIYKPANRFASEINWPVSIWSDFLLNFKGVSEETITVQWDASVKWKPTEFCYLFRLDDFFSFSQNSVYKNEAFY